jgi:hypothetical protein
VAEKEFVVIVSKTIVWQVSCPHAIFLMILKKDMTDLYKILCRSIRRGEPGGKKMILNIPFRILAYKIDEKKS